MTAVPKPKVVHDPEWLAHLRTCPCFFHPKGNCQDWTTFGKGPSEVSHLDGRSNDSRCLPMSGSCHRTGLIAWHKGQESFCKVYGTTKEILIAKAEALYHAFTEDR